MDDRILPSRKRANKVAGGRETQGNGTGGLGSRRLALLAASVLFVVGSLIVVYPYVGYLSIILSDYGIGFVIAVTLLAAMLIACLVWILRGEHRPAPLGAMGDLLMFDTTSSVIRRTLMENIGVLILLLVLVGVYILFIGP